MASLCHLPSMRPTKQNHYPKHSKTLPPHSDHKVFLMKYKSRESYPNFKTPLIFKSPRILPFTGKKLLRKAQKDSDGETLPESDTTWSISERKNTGAGVLLYLSERARLYVTLLRVLRPGVLFFMIPIWWAIALAADAGTFADAKMLALFSFVSVLSHGYVCVINDYLDRDIYAKVERTKSRPLASGQVNSFEAFCLMGFSLLASYVLLLPVNELSRILWVSTMPLFVIYPLTKRVTYWAQGFLGLSGNLSVFYAWSAVKGSVDVRTLLPIYIAGTCFTIVYDTIYAHMDREDDQKIGLKSTAILFGDLTKEWATVFNAACIGGLTLTGLLANIGWPYYPILATASVQLAWKIWTVDLSSKADCFKTFQTCRTFGALIFLGIALGRLYQ